MGAGVSLTHGIQALFGSHHEITGSNWAIGILIFSFVIESFSLGTAIWAMNGDAKAKGQGFVEYVRTTDDPFGVAVLMEDFAAVFGVLVALAAVGLTAYTHNPMWDALGTIAIGILLGLMAAFLIRKNRTFLLGKSISKKDKEKLRNILKDDPAVDQIAMQAAIVRGTDSYRVSAELDFNGAYLAEIYLKERKIEEVHARLDSPEAVEAFLKEYGEEVMEIVGDEVDRIEKKIREAIPQAKHIAIEPD